MGDGHYDARAKEMDTDLEKGCWHVKMAWLDTKRGLVTRMNSQWRRIKMTCAVALIIGEKDE